ncbi:glycosyltransferase family 2 protein [Pseudoxanthomonas sacheonensis]|uniref:GT2 family glycosyltransferase n=1 Tax=Pseudoxanthomonas sacheonensis TaxID=443615 RepID=A0ABU1RWH8_9GAMM|nr:glycosyltransferase [Pseudoxanthomonas sacheonensis]MDR6843114.1 GT2 family glycosyltransferase [Pseudoxanthomonas sacheonensis]
MTHRPRISVCIANYNGAEVIHSCIDSVLRQECEADVEVIVHDDASTDGSAKALADTHPDIRIIFSDENVGFCISNNRMAAIAEGEYLLLLNNDAMLRNGALQAMCDAATSGSDGILSVPQYQASTGQLLDRGCRLDCLLMPIPVTASDPHRPVTVMGSCLWIPKRLWERIGGFPEWIASIGEDTFLCLGAWQAGVRVHVIDGTGYDHVVGLSFGGGKAVAGKLSTTTRRRFLSERNRICVLAIFCPPLLLPLALLIQTSELIVEGIAMSLVKRDTRFLREVVLAAIASAWKLRRVVCGERRRMQASFGAFPIRRWLGLITPLPQKLRAVWRHGIPDVQ